MSVSNTTTRFQFTGDGAQTAFPMTNCLVYASAHVQVYKDGVLQGSGYTVSGLSDAAGATVTFSVAPASGVKVLLIRVVPLTQLTTYAVAGAFPAKTTEKDLDLATMQSLQLDEVDDRAIQWPVAVTTAPSNQLPDPSVAANQSKVLRIAPGGLSIDLVAVQTTDFANPLTTKGDLVVHNGTGSVRLPVGADGEVLEVDSTDPEGVKWQPAAIKKNIVDAKGDLIVATAADTVARKAAGTNGRILLTDSAQSDGLAYGAPAGHLWGLILSNNGVDPTNDIDVTAGEAVSNDAAWTDRALMRGSALTKQLDVAWAVGNNAGFLDTGAVGNNTYHIFAIMRTDTGVVDYLASLSATAPTMPTNYDKKRLIGSILRTAGAIKLFKQDGDLFQWDVPVNDVAVTNPGTAAVTRTLTLPTGRNFLAWIGSYQTHGNAGGAVTVVLFSDLAVADTAPGTAASSYAGGVAPVAGADMADGWSGFIRTNTSAQIRSRLSASDASTNFYVNTLGWRDTRGKDN